MRPQSVCCLSTLVHGIVVDQCSSGLAVGKWRWRHIPVRHSGRQMQAADLLIAVEGPRTLTQPEVSNPGRNVHLVGFQIVSSSLIFPTSTDFKDEEPCRSTQTKAPRRRAQPDSNGQVRVAILVKAGKQRCIQTSFPRELLKYSDHLPTVHRPRLAPFFT